MENSKRLIFFGIVSTLLVLTAAVFGILWYQMRSELRIRNQEVGELRRQVEELLERQVEQEKRAQEKQKKGEIPGEAVGLKLITVNGGEAYSLDSSIRIEFSISESLMNSLTDKDVTQIYLTNSDGIIGGFITGYALPKLSVGRNVFLWNPKKLIHDAGLDTIEIPPQPGRYRILVLVRKSLEVGDPGIPLKKIPDLGRVLFTSQEMTRNNFNPMKPPYYQYISRKIVFYGAPVWLDTPAPQAKEYELIASDISDSDFTLR